MLGDICPTCETSIKLCSCETICHEEPEPKLPCDNGECSAWLPMDCVFWMGDPIPGTPIKKGMRLTEVVTYLLFRINSGL